MVTTISEDYYKFRASLKQKNKPTIISNQFKAYSSNKNENNSQEFKRISKHISNEGRIMLSEPNAGGNSVFSEVLSYEILRNTMGAKLLKTEMQIQYRFENSKITDYSVMMNDKKIGVSVTRAFHFMGDEHFNKVDAYAILCKKLKGVISSTQCVSKKDAWEKQILHVFVRSNRVAKLLNQVYRNMKCPLKSNTIVLITVCENAECIFTEKSCDH
ncbi:hypothetical protein AKO1_007837 [Acrasis kona]|uniref:Uncharacterized protein n=1 Tax=Acrasis kona TaxID=1008807 RepID=A0AAW2YNQ7_9EUKA